MWLDLRYEHSGHGAPRGCAAPAKTSPRRKETITMTKVAVGGVIVAFLVFYVMTSPDQAATIFQSSWHAVVNVAHGVGHFFDKLAS
jgi:hypothetical protein